MIFSGPRNVIHQGEPRGGHLRIRLFREGRSIIAVITSPITICAKEQSEIRRVGKPDAKAAVRAQTY